MCTMVERSVEKTEQVKTEGTTTNKSRSRNWTEEEVDLFASILADNNFGFATSLEGLAAKKSSNREVFTRIKHTLDNALNADEFRENNGRKNFPSKDGMYSYELLDTSIEKLRKKYSNLKAEWRKRAEQSKTTSGGYLDKDPLWFGILNSAFASIGDNTQFASLSDNTQFASISDNTQVIIQPLHYTYSSDNKINYPEEKHTVRNKSTRIGKNTEKYMTMVESLRTGKYHTAKYIDTSESSRIEQSTNKTNENNVYVNENDNQGEETEETTENYQEITTTKIFVKPRKSAKPAESSHRKRKMECAPFRTLNQLAKSVQELAASQIEINKFSIENEFKRDQMYLRFCAEEAEKNRRHELRLAEIYTSAFSSSKGAASLMPVPLTTQVTSFPKPRRRAMLFDHARSEYIIPTASSNFDTQLSNSITNLRNDSVYCIPDEE